MDECVGEWGCEMDGKMVASSACMIRRRPRWTSAEEISVQVLTGAYRSLTPHPVQDPVAAATGGKGDRFN